MQFDCALVVITSCEHNLHLIKSNVHVITFICFVLHHNVSTKLFVEHKKAFVLVQRASSIPVLNESIWKK